MHLDAVDQAARITTGRACGPGIAWTDSYLDNGITTLYDLAEDPSSVTWQR